jgi:endonuclease G, mitochondrial
MNFGYDPDFIGNGISVPMPTLIPTMKENALRKPGLRENLYLDYTHYTVAMYRRTRQLIFAASNIDQKLFKQTKRGDNWMKDARIADEDQLNNEYYKFNEWDKGHMVMRSNTAWGKDLEEAQTADDESFFYTNAAFQHMNMNRDEWRGLEEDVVRKFGDDANDKLCVFTGPIHGPLDRNYQRDWHDSVRIPSGFFKVVCYQKQDDLKLGVKAFAVFQDDEIIRDKKGRQSVKYKEYQVTISELKNMTGLDFGAELFNENPLFFFPSDKRTEEFGVRIFPERIPIDCVDDMKDHDEQRLTQEPLPGRKIAIAAAMVDPPGADKGNEWVSLHNRTNDTLQIDGWELRDQKNRISKLSGEILPGGTKILRRGELEPVLLRNTGGSLRLVSNDPCLIDHVTWTKHDSNLNSGLSILFGT